MHQNTDWEKEFDELFCYRDSKDGRMKLHAMTAFADNYKDFIRSLLQAREEWLKGEIEKKLAKARDYYQETRLQPLEGEMSAFRDVLSLINKK